MFLAAKYNHNNSALIIYDTLFERAIPSSELYSYPIFNIIELYGKYGYDVFPNIVLYYMSYPMRDRKRNLTNEINQAASHNNLKPHQVLLKYHTCILRNLDKLEWIGK